MPVLVFHDPPPGSNVEKPNVATHNTEIGVKNTPSSPTINVAKSILAESTEESKFPIARMDTESISNITAARLTSTLLGHVLFLKNQVPFPVLQLAKMPAGKSSARATKQRQEMLASFDTICSHLDTTFSALSTAIARCSSSKGEETAQVYMAILVGPSLSTAKSKVILGIDGLENRIWGARDDIPPQADEDLEDEEDSSDGEDSDDEDSEGSEQSDDSGSQDEEGDEDGEGIEQPADSESEGEEMDDDDDDNQEEEEEHKEGGNDTLDRDMDSTTEAQPAKLSPVSISPPVDYISPAEQERLLKSADRLLSRTLASADAAGNGFFSEISPTQTHVLLRAPRRFNHPAWIPRQNVASSLDTLLSDFLNGSCPKRRLDSVNGNVVGRHPSKNKPEGIWITTRHGIRTTPPQVSSLTSTSEEELDDMIWWSWDGKFVGFADW
ncbi:hypothetical protein BJ165DRAFT_1350726 [Panaeolus papilionaceus]|nr:hypothetical protein BJ165DRAFT_1350726 [Panaeolus papilionaceus]